MTFFESFRVGIRRSARTPRLVVFSWLAQLFLSLIVAIPMMLTIDRSVKGTVYEDVLLQRLDANWLATFQYRNDVNVLASLLSPSVTSIGPFLQQADALLRGGAIAPLAAFLREALFSFSFRPDLLTLPLLVLLVASLMNSAFAAGFIATYRTEYPPTIGEFLSMGAAYFGPFVRILLVSFLIHVLLVFPLIGSISRSIADSTAMSASEATPFAFYMLRNLFAVVLFVFVTLVVDIARVRMVLERRTSAVVAVMDGARFVIGNAAPLGLLSGAFLVITVVAMALFGLSANAFPQSTYVTIALLFVLQQVYMMVRSYLRAAMFASETVYVQRTDSRS